MEISSAAGESVIDLRQYKRVLRWFWGGAILAALACYLAQPELFAAAQLRQYIGENSQGLLLAYAFVSALRAIFFLPSTIFVFMGTALFPTSPVLVILISMAGILAGATLIYGAADFLKPEHLFSERHVGKMESVRGRMERYGFWIVLLWSFFPAVPTDLICFVAGTIRMSYWKFFLAVFAGELILVNLYVWTGKSLIQLIV